MIPRRSCYDVDMPTVKRPIKDLLRNPKNPRVIRDKRFMALKESLKQDPHFLDARPIVVNSRTGQLVCGNQRLEAAKALGWTEVPVWEAELTDEEADRWMLKDNTHYGEHDWDVLANSFDPEFLKGVGFDDKELDRLLGKVDHSADDEFDPGAILEAKTPLWRVGGTFGS